MSYDEYYQPQDDDQAQVEEYMKDVFRYYEELGVFEDEDYQEAADSAAVEEYFSAVDIDRKVTAQAPSIMDLTRRFFK